MTFCHDLLPIQAHEKNGVIRQNGTNLMFSF